MAVIAGANSAFNYYSPLQIQHSISKRSTKIFSPVNALQAGAPFEFFANVGGPESGIYIDLAASKFYFKFQAVKEDESNPVAADHISCINNLAHSTFSKIQVWLGDKEVGDANSLYPFRAYIAHLLFRSKEAQDTWMVRQGWFARDIEARFDSIKTDNNAAVLARYTAMGKGEIVPLEMHPELDIFNSDLYIPAGLPVKIRFTPAKNNFILMKGEGNAVVKVKISDAQFYCACVHATPSQHLANLRALKDIGPMRMYGTHTTLKHITVGATLTTLDRDNIYWGEIPNRIILAMIRDDALAGSLTLNPFHFQHFDLNELGLLVNGEPVPTNFFSPDFTAARKDYIKDYTGVLEALNKAYAIQPIPLKLTEWAGGFSIFAFDLTPDQNNGRTHSPQGKGTIRLHMRFANALPQTIAVLLIAEYDNWIEIDQHYNVTTAFN